MKPERMRIKIAEACGYSRCPEHDYVAWAVGGYTVLAYRDKSGSLLWDSAIPNYHESHDAMAEALPMLDKDERYEYLAVFEEVIGLWRAFDIHTATPIQKAEAFLRAKGLWEEEE